MAWYEWKPYVPVAQRRARARRAMSKRLKKGLPVEPVEVKGRTITRTFWGQAWCRHLEKFSDFSNRLPRGRAYVNNGSVCHLEIASGKVQALVMGSELYEVRVGIKKLTKTRWREVKAKCAGGIATLLELLEGRLSRQVMSAVTHRDTGIFPLPREIAFHCNCPDWAVMCKHVAAVLYGVGARLDEKPELLFLLRGVDHEELISADAGAASIVDTKRKGRRRIAQRHLADVFDIDIVDTGEAAIHADSRVTRSKTPERTRKIRIGTEATNAVPAANVLTGNPRTTRRSKKASARLIQRKTVGKTRSGATPRSLTGAEVRRLREKLDLSRAEFAKLLGVSSTTVYNWENAKGHLKLQSRTREVSAGAGSLSKKTARKRLGLV